MEKTAVTQNQIINQLLKIGHKDLGQYTDVGMLAAQNEPELLGRMISWNRERGKVRDTKVALPVLALRGPKDDELFENAVAHMALLSPRDLLRALSYNRELPPITPGAGRKWVKRMGYRYIKAREENRGWWNRTALQHRKSLKSLYGQLHIKPNAYAQDVLFDNNAPAGSVFEALKQLKNMDAKTAAGTILVHRIPFLIAVGALGGIKDKPDVLIALMEQMSGSEIINNTDMLKRLGVMDNPVLRAAYEGGLEKAKADKRVSTLKAGKAAEAVGDMKLKAKLANVQETKLAQTGGIDGDWLILADKSGSMSSCIEMSRQIAALIAQQVNGAVHLIFFDTRPLHFKVNGKSHGEIKEMTKRVSAGGGTSGGCGLSMLRASGENIDGIVICGDGEENTAPYFSDEYVKYCHQTGNEPTVYFFGVNNARWSTTTSTCELRGISVEFFEMGRTPDYYALPELVSIMRAQRYKLVDEIMQTPLLTLDSAFKHDKR